MRKPFLILLPYLLAVSMAAFPNERQNTLGRIVESLSSERGMVNARRAFDIALLNQRHQRLQWWRPAAVLGNDLIYPYKRSAFDALATSNSASLFLSLPLHTGTTFEIASSYGINRSMAEETLKWGFSQDVQGRIGVRQSLSPWWLHTRNNPFSGGAALQAELAQTEFNIAAKGILFSCLRAYIDLRRAERNAEMLAEKIALFDDMLASYRRMLLDGAISMREFQNARSDKWEHEQALLALEQNMASLQTELYGLSGVQVAAVSAEELIDAGSSVWLSVFLGVSRSGVALLEQTAVSLQKTGLHFEGLISRQSAAPSVLVEFGSSFTLPTQETGGLSQAWRREHFTDGERSNWALNVSVDLSSLLSSAERRRRLEQRISENALDALAARMRGEEEAERAQNSGAAALLETHIAWLAAIIADDSLLAQDMRALYERGGVSELEYRQAAAEFKEKRLLLESLNDELWFRRFLGAHYYLPE